MNTRNMLNHGQVGQNMALSSQVGQSIGQSIGQVGQNIGLSGRSSSMGSSGLGSPSRCSPSIICMPKQQPARQPFTINR